MSRLRRWGVFLALALALSGCLGDMPSSGPIGFGRENSAAPQSNFVRTIVSPPASGADALGIVRGFMTAAAGDIGSFATARLYLAPEVRDEWRPQSEIRVVADRDMAWEHDNLRAPGLVRFSSTKVARINTEGEYRLESGSYGTSFRLRLVNREWRISALPDGLTLSESELARSYRSVAIYYVDRTRSVLVPNQIHLPVRPALATAMVRALLKGPTQWLAPSVVSALPAGTTLKVNAVPIVDGVATVDLSENVAQASSTERSLLSAQLIHTLRQITEIRGVRITAGGVPLSVPGIDRTQSILSWNALGPDAANNDGLVYLSTPAGLSSLSLSSASANPRLLSSLIPDYTRGLRWPSVTREGDRLVAIDSAGNLVTAELTREQGDDVAITGLTVVLPRQGGEFLRPRWDLSATYWVAVRGTQSLRVFSARIGAAPLQASVPVWGRGTISAFATSRDGTRAVVSRFDGLRSEVFLMRVVREGRGDDSRVRLEEPIRIATLTGTVSDLSWNSASQPLALAGQPGSQRQIWALSIDGAAPNPVGSPINAVAIAAAPGRAVMAETADQRLVILRDQRWVELTAGRDPSFSG